MRGTAVAVVMVCALRALSAGPDSLVRVWEDTIELPTYAEDAPNPNPPFNPNPPAFKNGRAVRVQSSPHLPRMGIL